MKVNGKYYDEVFDFKGQWDMPSKCGLKIISRSSRKTYIIVTELYQDNPGTSVTQAGSLLAKQVCEAKGFDLNDKDVVYIECTPDTDSVLSFYGEEFFEVTFGDSTQAIYRKLTEEEVKEILSNDR